jgi:hypothetical protein
MQLQMLKNFQNQSQIINTHLKNLYDKKTTGLPQYEQLTEVNYHVENDNKDQNEYITLLYFAIKDLIQPWYTRYYEINEILSEQVNLTELRIYQHDQIEYIPKRKKIRSFKAESTNILLDHSYHETEIVDEKGNYHRVIEEFNYEITKLEEYENGKIEESAENYKNNQKVIEKLDVIFPKRKIDSPERTFEYFIEYINQNPLSFEKILQIEPLEEKKVSIIESDSENIHISINFLYDIWNGNLGKSHYDQVIEFLKNENTTSGATYIVTNSEGNLQWDSQISGKFIAGFWKVCKKNGFIDFKKLGKSSAEKIANILGNTFSCNPAPKYFEPNQLDNFTPDKFTGPFDGLPLLLQ